MYKFGRVTLVGKPNAGKSTLLNYFIGEKISIVSPKAQTTRDVITGVATTDEYQIAFVDTPGSVKGASPLTKYMSRGISAASADVDLILYLIDGEKPFNSNVLEEIGSYAKSAPVIAVITKLDRANKAKLIPVVESVGKIENVKAIIPISVFKNKNLDELTAEILKYIPEGEKCFDEDFLTDKPMRFLVAERIREKILYHYHEEIPHGISVEIAEYDFDEKKNLYTIYADIICEKQSHKGILIGKNGEALKDIASRARVDLERFTEAKVFLTIFVKVKENWRENPRLVNEFGYNSKNYDD